MPSRAYIKVTKTTSRRARTRSPDKSKTVDLGTGTRKRCPTCGKYMGSGKRG